MKPNPCVECQVSSVEWRVAGGEGGRGVKGIGEIEEKKWLIWGFNHRFSLVMGCSASNVT